MPLLVAWRSLDDRLMDAQIVTLAVSCGGDRAKRTDGGDRPSPGLLPMAKLSYCAFSVDLSWENNEIR